jgi:hypothetical protein
VGGDGVTPESVAAVDKNLPGKHEYHMVPNSGHFAFLTLKVIAAAAGN